MEGSRRDRGWLWGLLAAGLALRLVLLDPWSAHHPDEYLQYLEGAHRLAFGEGLVPWDVRAGIRSSLIPYLVAGPMAAGAWLAPGTDAYLWLPRLFTTLINCLPIVAAWAIGRRQSRLHAIAASGAVALWLETALFAVSLLSEALSLSFAFVGLALLITGGKQRMLPAGLMLGLAVLLRPQNAPALGFAILLFAGRDRAAWARILVGGAVALAVGALLDLLRGVPPYAWVWESYHWNFAAGRQAELSDVRHASFFEQFERLWRWPGLLLFGLPALWAARTHWRLLAVAAVHIGIHLLLTNEEYRYFLLGTQLILLVGALGLADAVALLSPRWERASPALLLIALAGASLLLSSKQPYRTQFREDPAIPRFAAAVARNAGKCALGVPAANYALFPTSLLRSDGPILPLAQDEPVPPELDRLLVWASHPPPPPPFRKSGCAGRPGRRICLWEKAPPRPCEERLPRDSFQRWLESNRL